MPWAAPVHLKEYRNHNRMLFSYAGTYGVKTGFTTAAGACLVVASGGGTATCSASCSARRNIWTDMPRLLDATLNAVPASG